MLSSNFDDTGTLERKRESVEDNQNNGNKEKPKNSLRNSGDEDETGNSNESNPKVAGPNGKEVDQPSKGTP